MLHNEEPRKKAVALKYNAHEDAAPVVVAKGQGEVAERIITIAREHEIIVQEDPELANYLYGVEIFDQIPMELYGVVAELLAFVYHLDQKAGIK
ncbi:MAG: EscU/YscU/HrcU family type III secretion system export apparatus switch protein [Methylocystaceae bacterium]